MTRRKPARPRPHRRPLVEEWEPRVLHSADVPAAMAALLPGLAEVRPLDDGLYAVLPGGPQSAADVASCEVATTGRRHEIVFIDVATPGWQELLDDIRAQGDRGRQLDAVLIDPARDGVAQIGAALAEATASGTRLSAVHIISHGAAGQLQVGASTLDGAGLERFREQIAAWGEALDADGDILIYGCDVAQGEQGRAFVQALSALTGADVAASEDLTGSAALGGDWVLEYTAGSIDTGLAPSTQAQQDWAAVLAISAGNSTSAGMASGATASSLTWSHTVASGGNGVLIVNVAIRTDSSTPVSSVSYGGTALSFVSADGSSKTRSEMWVLKAPAAGTANVVVTLGSSANFTTGATNFFGVDQTTPFSAIQTANGSGNPSLTIVSAAGEVVVDAVADRDVDSETIGAGQTALLINKNGSGSGDAWAGSSTEAGAASVTMSWTTTGAGAGEWAAVAVSLRPVANQPPVNAVPGAQTTNEDANLVFSAANGNQISISEADAGSNPPEVTLSVTNGALTLAGTAGLTFTAGDGAGDASMTFRGTVANINAALNGLSYLPTANYSGGATLTLATLDSTLVSLNFDASLKGRYSFDNGADPGNDSSPAGANDGVVNGATPVSDATRGNVLSFDGNDYVQVAGRFGNPANVTVAAWVNLTAADSGGAEVISLGDSVAVRLDDINGVKGFWYDGSNWHDLDSGQFVAGTGWHHVAYAFDDTNNVNTLYIDGVQVASATASGPISYSLGANTFIGRHGNGEATWDFTGRVDDARIYSRALTATEIANLANDLTLRDTDTVAITVSAVNDAPSITNGALVGMGASYSEDSPTAGFGVSGVVGSVGWSDVDAGAVRGMIVVGSTGNGTWQYSTDLGTWHDVGAVSAGNGLLLSDTSWLRYVGDGQNGETPTVQFRAWDMSSGTASTNAVPSYANPGAGGGTSAFSTGTATGRTTINSVNDAPVLGSTAAIALTAQAEDSGAPVGLVGTYVSSLADLPGSGGALDNVTDVDSGALTGIAVTAADTANGGWWYSTNGGGTWNALGAVSAGSARLLAADAGTLVYFQPNADYNGSLGAALTFRAWDRSSGANGGLADTTANGGTTAFSTATDSASLTVSAVNDAPLNILPPNAYTALDTSRTFSAAGGNAIQIADVDAAGGAVQVTLSVTNGTLALASTTGLTLAGGANGAATMTWTGTVSAFNTAFNAGLSFTPTAGFRGLAQLTLATGDQGNTGSGGALGDSDTLNIHVGAIVVTNTSDTSNGNVSSIASLIAGDGGDGISLREAIQAANITAGTDTIHFDLGGSGPHTINLTSALPTIAGSVVLDGGSEPDFGGYSPVIELNGAGAGAGVDGLTLAASDSTIRAIAINRFSGNGLVISGNNNTVQLAFIGTDVDGAADLGNAGAGILVTGQGNQIGGGGDAEYNVIAGNAGAGIRISGATATGNVVVNSNVGLALDGVTLRGNDGAGILIENGAALNRIGGTAGGESNHIAGNGGDGICVTGNTTVANAFLENLIHGNAGLAIDLGDDGVTANDGGDGDSGPNALQNFPLLSAATVSGSTLTITGTLNSAAGATYRIEVYRVAAADADATGRGEVSGLLGSFTVTTDGAGNAFISHNLSGVVIAAGDRITATATQVLGPGSYGSTSEFALNIAPAFTGSPGVTISAASPTPLGNEFRVNTTTAGDQWVYYWSVRTVAVAPDGGFVQVWIDTGGADGSQSGIFGQRFDAAGNKIGGEFQVNTNTSQKQDDVSIAMAGDGSFVVLWDGPGDGSNTGIFGQRFNAAGGKVGGEFLVNTTTSGTQQYPELDFAADGSFVASWVNQGNGGTARTMFQRFDAGANKIGGEVTLITGSGADQVLDSLDVKADGSFIVTWTESGDVYGRRYDASTNPAGAEFRINQYLTGTQQWSVARADAAGNFVVVWQSSGQDGSGDGIYGRRFAADGTALGNEFAITSQSAGDQYGAVLSMDRAGNFVVAWTDGNALDGSAESIWLQRFDANGNRVGTPLQVNQTSAGYQAWPVMDMNDRGQLVVAWEGNGPGDSYGVFAQRYQLNPVVTEGATTTFTVVLDAAPTAAVTISLAASDASEITLSTATLSFDGSNWSIPQTVTLTGVQDWALDGDVHSLLVTGTASSADPAYDGMTVFDLPVLTLDSGVVNAAPVITSNGGGASAAVSIAENTTAVTTVSAGDANAPPQTLTYAISGGADAAKFTLDSATGALSFLTAPNFEAPTDAGGNNVYDVTVQVSDGYGGTDTQAIAVTVTNVNDAPTAAIVPASYTATEQTSLTLHGTGLSIADPDAGGNVVQATVSVTAGTLNAGAGTTGVTVSGSGSATLTLTGTLTQINNLLAGNLGATLSYIHTADVPPPSATLTLQVSDLGNSGPGGTLTGSDTATLNISAVNDAPTTGNTAGGAAEDASYITLVLNGADVDGTVTQFQLASLPANGSLYLDAALTSVATTGANYAATSQQLTLYFAPAANWNGSTSFQYFAVDNLGLADATPATGTFTASAVNDAPTRTAASVSLATIAEDTAAPAGATVSSLFAPAYSDAADQVSGGSSANALAGVAVTANAASAAAQGRWQWYDGASWADVSTSVSTTSALVLSSGTLVRFLPNAEYNGAPGGLTVRLIDDSGGAVTAGATVNVTTSGGTTPYGNAGNAVVLDTLVSAVNDAPVITSNGGGAAAAVGVAENTTAVTTVTSTDIDGGAPVYSIAGGADAALFTLDAATGALSFVAAPDFEAPTDAGANNVYDVTVQVSDGAGGTDTQAIAVTVSNVNEAPLLTLPGTQVTGRGVAITLSNGFGNAIQVADADAGAAPLRITLSADSGTLTLATTAGLSFTQGDGTSDAAMTFQGTLAALNAALNGLVYTPAAGYTGIATLAVTANDLGASGSGGAQVASGSVTVEVVVETLVNTTTSGNQTEAAVAMDAIGNSVVVWTSDGNLDGNGKGIFAQRFDAAGNKLGGQIQVNTTGAGDQNKPAVAMDAAGNFVVVWASNAQDGDKWGLYGQRFDAAGNKLGGEFRANVTTTGNQDLPSVAMATDGRFVVAWKSDQGGTKFDIYVRRYDAAGNALGGEVRANSNLVDAQDQPSVGIDAAGNFVVAWKSASGGTGKGVYAQRFDAAGSPQGGEFRVNTTDSGDQDRPTVGVAADGRFVVAWTSGNNQDGDKKGVYAQRYSAAGVAQGGEFRANLTTAGDQDVAAVAMDGDGNFTLAWASNNQDGNGKGIYARRFDAAGNALTGEFRVNSTTSNNQDLPAVAMSRIGDLAIVWQGNGLGDTAGVFLQVYRTANDAPVNTVPGAQTTAEDTALVFSTANGNRIAIADVDAVSSSVQVTLAATNGTLTLGGVAGLSFISGDGTGDASMSFTGTVAAINAALEAQRFTPTANFNGAASLAITTNDLGGNGSGGALGDSDTVGITVSAVNDAPVLDNSGTMTLTPITEDATSNSGNAVFSIIASAGGDRITDADGSVFEGIAITGTATGNGTWQYSTDGGVTWNGVGAVSNTSALLLRETDRLRFVPDGQNADAASVTFRAWDETAGAPGSKVDTSVNGGASAFSTATETATITVTAVNDAPLITSNGGGATAAVTVAENTTAVTVVTSTDVDGGAPAFGIAGGADAARFTIDAASGALSFVAPPDFDVPLDAGADNVYDLIVQVSDGAGGFDTQAIAVTVSNINQAPAGADRTLTTSEDTPYTFAAADFGFTDPDAGDVLAAVRIDALPAAGSLTLSGAAVAAGQVIAAADIAAGRLVFTPAPDAFGAGYATLGFSVRDAGGLFDAAPNTLTVDVTPVNDEQAVAVNTGATVAENSTGNVLGAALLRTTDVDNTPAQLLYTLTAAPAHGVLRLGGVALGAGGGFTQADIDAGLLSYDHDGSETAADAFGFSVDDGAGAPAAGSFTLTITPVNDNAPVITSNGGGATAAVTLAENATAVTTVAATDADLPAQGISYSIVGGADAARFSIDAASGALSFVVVPDREAPADANGDSLYEVIVRAGDGSLGDIQALSITVADVDEFDVGPIADADPAADSVAENSAIGTPVGLTAQAADPDATTSTVAYSLDDSASGRFAIDAASGVVTVAGPLDFEAATSHGIVVRATSADGSFSTRAFTVAVADVNDNAPQLANGSTLAYLENQAATPINTALTVTDADNATLAAATVAITAGFVTGEDVLAFANAGGMGNITASWDGASGVLTLSSAGASATLAQWQEALRAVSYENLGDAPSTAARTVAWAVSDGALASNVLTSTVDVTAVNDAPTGSDRTVTTAEDAAYVFTAADFGFGDAADASAHALAAVRITTLPGAGSLTLNGVAVGAGQFISRTDLDAGRLAFTPVADAFGAGYASFTFQVRDDGGTANGGVDLDPVPDTLTLDVTPVNDAPFITSDGGGATAALAVAENATAVTPVTSGDIDGGAPVYSIAGGADAGRFAIDAATGVLAFIAAPDFETPADADGDNVYEVVVQVSDGALADTQALSVSVTDQNDNAPVIGAGQSFGVAENTPAGTVVGTAAASDADTATVLGPWSIVGGNSGGAFAIDAASGVIRVADAAALDFETNPVFDLALAVSDGVNTSAVQTVRINLANVNEAPAGADRSLATAEDTPLTLAPADFGFTDPDAGDTLAAVRIDALPGVGSLTLAGVAVVAGQVIDAADIAAGRLVFTAAPDANGAAYAAIGFSVGDAGGLFDAAANTLTVDVSAVNDEQVLAANSGMTVAENATGTVITAGMLAATDVDHAPGQLVYTVTAAPASGTLRLNGVALGGGDSFTQADIDAGRLAYDHDGAEGAADGFGFSLDDGVGAATAGVFAITITPVNDQAPVITSDGGGASAAVGIAENATAVTTVAAGDADLPAQTLTYSIVGGADAARFTIDAASGALSFVVAPDFETPADADADNGYEVIVQASDGSLTDTQTLTVTVGNVNEGAVGAVADVDAAPDRVAENSAAGTVVGVTARASDPDTPDTIAYGLDDDAGGRFAIDAASGVVTVADGSLLDREAAASHDILVRALSSDGSVSVRGFTIVLSDVDEFDVGVAADADAAPDAVAENSAFGTPVGIAAFAADADATNNAVIYALDDDAGGRFAIDAASGVIRVAGPLDYEGAASHIVVVRADSADGSSASRAFTIAVLPVNEAPWMETNSGAHMNEGDVLTLTGAQLRAGDVDDAPADLAYTVLAAPAHGSLQLGGMILGTGSRFTQADIDAGLLIYTHDGGETLADGFDFEVGDASGLTAAPARFTIAIAPVNDAPWAGDLQFAGAEDTVATGSLLASAGDAEADTLAAEVLAGPAHGRVELAADGAFTYTPDADWNGEDRFSYRVSDGAAVSAAATVRVTVSAVNDAPQIRINRLAIGVAETVTLTAADVAVGDPDSDAAQIVLSVEEVAHGRFELAGAPGVAVGAFTVEQLQRGMVRFVQDGSLDAPVYTLGVRDQADPGMPDAASVAFSTGSGGDGAAPTPAVTAPSLPSPPRDEVAAPTPPEPDALPRPATPEAAAGGPAETAASPAPAAEVGGARPARGDAAGHASAVWRAAPLAAAAAAWDSALLALGEASQALASGDVPGLRIALVPPGTRLETGVAAQGAAQALPATGDGVQIVLNLAQPVGISLTVGAVAWATRAGGLIASMLATLPAWRGLDPLPILQRPPEEDPGAGQRSVGAHPPGAGPPQAGGRPLGGQRSVGAHPPAAGPPPDPDVEAERDERAAQAVLA